MNASAVGCEADAVAFTEEAGAMEEAVVTVTPDGAYVAGNSQGVSFFICCMRDTIKLQALHLWAYVFAWFMQ